MGASKKLHWPTFSSSQFFRDYARANNLSLEKADEQNEKLTKEVDNRIKNLLKENWFLIVEGWMAGIMADQIPNVLKVLLVCNEEERVRRFSIRNKISKKEAEQELKERETNWLNKIKSIYHRDDIFDTKYYNLVIDTTHLKPQNILAIVLKKLQN